MRSSLSSSASLPGSASPSLLMAVVERGRRVAVGVRARGKAVAAGADSAVAVAAGVDAAAVDGRAALPRSPVEGTADVGGALGGAMGGDREGLGMGGDREGLGGRLRGGGGGGGLYVDGRGTLGGGGTVGDREALAAP